MTAIEGGWDELLRNAATFLCLRDLVSLRKTNRRIHDILILPSFVAQYVEQHRDEGRINDDLETLEQLALSQSFEVQQLCLDNRIAVRSTRHRPAVVSDCDIPGSTDRIAYVQTLLRRHPDRLSVRVDGHASAATARPPYYFAHGIAFTVASAIRGTTTSTGVRLGSSGHRVVQYCAAAVTEHPERAAFAQTTLLSRDKGWVEIYLELDGWRCPPRPSYYDPIQSKIQRND